jgi:gliding motility-associated-like protein
MPIIRRQGLTAPVILFPVIFCLYINVYGQPIGQVMQRRMSTPARPAVVMRTNATEICNNGADDDNNLLTDEEDFPCYLDAVKNTACRPSPVIWGCSADGRLCWVNLATGTETMVGNDPGHFLLDLAWASDGKLYGIGGPPGGVFEIDPYTGLAAFKDLLPGPYIPGNAMTADDEGNLYMTAFVPGPTLLMPYIIKLNIATWRACPITNLSNTGISSAGDLTFINGVLYLSSSGNKIAKIDVHTGAMEAVNVINSSTSGYFGLTAMGDGYLYASDNARLYRIDPATMTAETTPSFTFSFPNFFLNGLANYAEMCHAPRCPPSITVQPSSPPPFCTNTQLMARTGISCVTGSVNFLWTTPDGNTQKGESITAGIPGKYVVRYQSSPDTCSAADSTTITFTAPVVVDLGADTSLCITEDLYLSPADTTGITAFRWQDGSSGTQLYATTTGWYWLDATGACGVVRDSMHVTFKDDGCARLVFIPSAFSPNHDGLNDVLKPIIRNKLAEYEFSVFNRWGQRVFTTRDSLRGWDGTINGQQQDAGLFTWLCRYRLNRKPAQSLRGTVLLVR